MARILKTLNLRALQHPYLADSLGLIWREAFHDFRLLQNSGAAGRAYARALLAFVLRSLSLAEDPHVLRWIAGEEGLAA